VSRNESQTCPICKDTTIAATVRALNAHLSTSHPAAARQLKDALDAMWAS